MLYFIKDECWNEAYACEYILVEDNVAPTPVCDEITQVTLDPESCWTRVPAEVLDDGSNDNCVQNLHFAVANMDTIEFYRDYWHSKLQECLDYDFYHYEQGVIDDLIEKWINCFVFQDYIDLSECGSEMLVLRVYEADGMPVYDPHLFKGTRHEWFCFNLYDDYACFYKYHYEEFANYEDPKIDLCDYTYTIVTGSGCGHEGGIEKAHPIVYDPDCQCNPDITSNCLPCERDMGALVAHSNEYAHGPAINRACCAYESPNASAAQREKWGDLLTKYPELSVMDCKRWKFQHLYNDCMIEVLKDDKTPPVCIAPADVSYYCDGLPVEGSFFPLNGNDEVKWTSAQYAHDICFTRDTFLTGCEFDRTNDAPSVYTAPNERWCVDIPWDGGIYGHYTGGPTSNNYDESCDDNYVSWYEEGQWTKPIYCRFWLLLDEFDDNSSGKPDARAYFGEPTIEENCWTYTDTSYIEGSLDECGVGILTKTWVISDKCGNTSECSQRVYVKPRSDFEVLFPADMVFNCNEENLDLEPVRGTRTYPQIFDDECELIGITYKDQILGEGDGCYKILRTWKIIDWCVYDPDLHYRYPDIIRCDRCVAGEDRQCVSRNLKDNGDGFMTYLQIIKIIDEDDPVVTCISDTTICSFDADCDVVFVDIEIGTATDNCTPNEDINYRYAIIPDYATDERDYLFGHGNKIRQPLPTGVHRVILYAMDDCNNIDSCSMTLELKDCKPPTPYCYDGIATVVMPTSGSVEVWATDLDAGSEDNCTPQDELIVSFDPDGLELARTFTCDDIPDGVAGEVEVEVYFTDEHGNTDFCIVTLVIQDNSGDICPDRSPTVSSETGYEKMLKNKEVQKGKTSQLIDNNANVSNQNVVILNQNRPNPYQNETIISFELSDEDYAKIAIMDLTGKQLLSKKVTSVQAITNGKSTNVL